MTVRAANAACLWSNLALAGILPPTLERKLADVDLVAPEVALDIRLIER